MKNKRKLTKRVTQEWSPRKSIIVGTSDRLVPNAGLESILYNFDQSNLSSRLVQCLPSRGSNNSAGSKTYGYMFVLGFLNGWDCIEDLEKLQENYWACAFFEGRVPGSRACGNFLRSFQQSNLDELNIFLRDQARAYHKNIIATHGGEEELIIDLDSTEHAQNGEKMEGLGWSYNNTWGLSSLLAYDQKGLCHGGSVRNGNAHTSVGGSLMVRHCFADLELGIKRFLRADSGYCNQEVIHACLEHKVKFTIVAHDNLNWKSKLSQIQDWRAYEYSDEEKQKAAKKGKELEKVEIGKLLLFPEWGEGKIAFPIIVRRFARSKLQGDLFNGYEYDYHGIISNFNLLEHSYEDVVRFYQKRANVENMIREEKHNYDLLHFPCQKLLANDAYAKLCLVAHNMLRHIAYLIEPKKPHFAKKLRDQFIQLPAKVVSSARQLYLKFSMNVIKEVKRLEQLLSLRAYDLSWNTS